MSFKIHSFIIKREEEFSTRIRESLDNVQTEQVCGIVVCGTSNTAEYHTLLNYFKESIYKVLDRRVPLTIIPQPLLPKGGFSIDIYTTDLSTQIEIRESQGVCYGIMNNEEESLLFIEGIPSSDFTESIRTQSQEIFGKLEALLATHDFGIDDIVRQWNYIGNIVSLRDGKQNYQEFNDTRTRYYAKGEWSNGYPAATGIGCSGEGVIIGCIAFKKRGESTKAIYPIDNPLQVAAHIYSKRVLIDNNVEAMKSTPKFERAKLVETTTGACCFVSGTAAIRGEQSEETHSAQQQTITTIENIKHLTSTENLVRYGCSPHKLQYRQIQVFIKRKEDYEEVKSVVEKAYPQVAVVYTLADVCRSELLVEIEGILTT